MAKTKRDEAQMALDLHYGGGGELSQKTADQIRYQIKVLQSVIKSAEADFERLKPQEKHYKEMAQRKDKLIVKVNGEARTVAFCASVVKFLKHFQQEQYNRYDRLAELQRQLDKIEGKKNA